jgi:hopanoid biosynthesis associated radical SAM protein HpnH
MRFPLGLSYDILKNSLKNGLRGNRRFPFVLMLEPLYSCNLACIGCATERHTGKIKDRLPVATCLQAVDRSGAPMVSICGGEPTLYPELDELIAGILARKRYITLCTNGILLDDRVFGVIPPDPRLILNIHLDGMRETHDRVCEMPGLFDEAIELIRYGKKLGYRVMTNTTVFKETRVEEIEQLCELMTQIGIDGMLISPGYHYESVEEDIFLTKAEIQAKFKEVLRLSRRYALSSTPMFLEFAAGLREYPCSPWSTVTFTPQGWKGPCYLIGKNFTFDWDEFWNQTDWDYWESRKDRLCQNCAMHSGFEASAVLHLTDRPTDVARMLWWNLAA